MSVSEATQKYWLETVLGWSESRLMPPQFDECKQVLDGLAAARAQIAALRALLERCYDSLLHGSFCDVRAIPMGPCDCGCDRLKSDISAALAQPGAGKE